MRLSCTSSGSILRNWTCPGGKDWTSTTALRSKKSSDRFAMSVFRVGITPDFYVDAKGRFEAALAAKLDVPGIEYAPMPPQPGNVATPEALDSFDAIFTLALQFTPESLHGVE